MDPSRSSALVAEVRISMISGVGPRLRQELLAAFGGPEAVFEASAEQLQRVRGIGAKLADKIRAAREHLDPEAELRFAAAHGLAVLSASDPRYPPMLRETHDPPGVLYVRGELLPQDQLAVGVVGTRHATRYGLAQAERLATGLARAGITVVSGLARGIDAAAHRAALAAGGRTIAVLAGGVMNVYPPEHEDLARQVSDSGCVLSEAPPRMPPLGGAFPQRNRVISGLSLGVIVVEAADRSGALITANHAAEQGRDVFAVPGPADSRASRGCHTLIRDGATLVTSAEEVVEQLGPLSQAVSLPDDTRVRSAAELSLNGVEQQVLQAISTTPTEIDAVVAAVGLPVPRVLATVSVLEMRRLVRRVSGQLVARV